jgi:formylglycine-generating enzyme required for sulfatase activity
LALTGDNYFDDSIVFQEAGMKLYALRICMALVACLVIGSCSKPQLENPFDPEAGITKPMQGELVLTQITDSEVKLDWQLNTTIVDKYIIKRRVNSGDYEVLTEVNKDISTYTDSGLLTTNTYHYQLIGANGDVQTDPLTDSIQTSFNEITNFDIQQQNVYSAKLTWQHDCSYEEGYVIERQEVVSASKDSGSKSEVIEEMEEGTTPKMDFMIAERCANSEITQGFIHLAALPADTYEFIDDTALPNRTYVYRIKSYTSLNESLFQQNQQLISFPAPVGFEVEQVDVHTFLLVWQDVAMEEQFYTIERRIDDDSFIVIAENIEPGIQSFSDDISSRNTFDTLYYKIYATYQEETSQIAVAETSIIFEPISNLSYLQLDVHTIQLSWVDSNDGEEGFNIEKKIDSGNWQLLDSVSGTSFFDCNAEVNHDLQYRVQVYCGSNATDFVETSIIDNTIPAPTNLSFTIENISYPSADIHLTWNYSMSGIDGFKVKKNGTLLNTVIPAGTTEWIDTEVNIINSNSYQIMAFSQDNISAYSNEVIPIPSLSGMIFVQGGIFEMGDHFNEGGSDELPVHDVTLDDFFIGTHEVTQGEYEAVVGSNPAHSYGVGDNYPVYYVSWYDAVTYCNLKSQQHGLTPCYNLSDWSCDFSANGYRLPTEAEWEYAARGGAYWEDDYKYSGTTENLSDYAWYSGNSSSQTHEVGGKLSNQLRIFNMNGNVAERCNDWYSADYYSISPILNPVGPLTGSGKVTRGGSWLNGSFDCRVAHRSPSNPAGCGADTGFRLVRSVE